MARGRKRTVEEVIALFKPLVGKNNPAVVAVAGLGKYGLRWVVEEIRADGWAFLTSADGADTQVSHVFDLVHSPVRTRGEGSAANRAAPTDLRGVTREEWAAKRVDLTKRAAEGEAEKKAQAEASIEARRDKQSA